MICIFEYVVMLKKAEASVLLVRIFCDYIEYHSYCIPGYGRLAEMGITLGVCTCVVKTLVYGKSVQVDFK